MSNLNSNTKRYVTLIHKSIAPVDTIPKQKHIKNIIMGTYQDNSLSGFINAILNVNFNENSISNWKFVIIIHSVLKNGFHNKQALNYLFSTISNLKFQNNVINDFYSENFQYYLDYVCAKINFHNKNDHISGNCTIKSQQKLNPFLNIDDSLNYLFESIEYFNTCNNTIEIILNAMNDGKNKSDVSGQNQLYPIFLILEDSLGLYNILTKLFYNVDEKCTEIQKKLTFFKMVETFSFIYFKFRKLCTQASGYSFLSNLIDIPQLSDICPIESLLAKKHVFESKNQAKIKNNINEGTLINLNDSINKIINQSNNLTNKNTNNILPQTYSQNQCTNQIQNNLNNPFANNYNQSQSNLSINQNENFANDKFIKIGNENNLNQNIEIDCDLDVEPNEKFNKLKEMYIELRTEYSLTKHKIYKIETEKNRYSTECKRKNNEIMEIKKNIENLNSEIRKKDSIISNFEIDKRNQEIKSNIELEKLLDQVKESDESVLSIKNQHKNEINELNNELNQLKLNNNQDKFIINVIEEILNLFDKININNKTNLQSKPDDIVQKLEIVYNHTDNFIKLPNFEKIDLLKFILNQTFFLFSMENIASGLLDVISDSEYSDKFKLNFKSLINEFKLLINNFLTQIKTNTFDQSFIETQKLLLHSNVDLHKFITFCQTIPIVQDVKVALPLPEDEISITKNKIEDAKCILAGIIYKAQQMEIVNPDKKLNVNKMILDDCTHLLDLLEKLINEAQIVQKEIIASSTKENKCEKEFYKKNHRWTEGLTSAAKAVGASINFLVQSADQVLSNDSSLEELIVASLDISACSAQLISSSRVKADPDSKNLASLIQTANLITKLTNKLVQSVTETIKLQNSDQNLDYTKLSVTQFKSLEMNIQIKCLQLESALDKERAKLLDIRSKNFHQASFAVENPKKK